MRKKVVIFIGGTSYSGSTMLDMMLSNHSNSFSLGEVSALYRPYRPHHFNPTCGCDDAGCLIWTQLKEAGEHGLYIRAFEMFPEVNYLIDSSKNQWWIKTQSERLLSEGIEVKHLLISKSPESFAHSMLKRGQKGWKRAWINYQKQYLTLIPDAYPILYDSLTEDTVSRLKRICEYIDLTYEVGMEDFWNKTHHTLFGNNSTKVHLRKNTGSADTDSYRKIYNKKDQVHDELPLEVMKEIQDNKDIGALWHFLVSRDKEGMDNELFKVSQITYGHGEMLLYSASDIIKRMIGIIIGRYYNLF
ncbi:MAG: hypothetical protein H8D23_13525 [Candidatus Brocadiales bacterium]|nr:hypothetical protein [Candidatus Brocadiales bacterium]